jgi:hypothetical protein
MATVIARSAAPRLEELMRTFRIMLHFRDLLDLPATSRFSLDDEAAGVHPRREVVATFAECRSRHPSGPALRV